MGNYTDSWIQTYCRMAVHPTNLRPENIRLLDIAHSLSNICRFNGHTNEFYSVAEHSVRLLWYIRDRLRSDWTKQFWKQERLAPDVEKWALLHDAAEAYLGDITKPMKEITRIDVLSDDFGWVPARASDVEKAALKVIATRFELSMPGHQSCPLRLVSACDYHMLAAEARDLLTGGPIRRWIDPDMAECIPSIEPWAPAYAKQQFLDEAEQLGLEID